MAFEMDFESEIPLSAIKSMICRRFSLFRFRFLGFMVVYRTRLRSSKLSVQVLDASVFFFFLLTPQSLILRKSFISVYSFYTYFKK